jgi:hypothetical protein
VSVKGKTAAILFIILLAAGFAVAVGAIVFEIIGR